MIEAIDVDTWSVDAGVGRAATAKADVNVVNRTGFGPRDWGAVWDAGSYDQPPAIAMCPPALLVTSTVYRRPSGEVVYLRRTVAIDQGRVWAVSPWSEWESGRRLSALVSVDAGLLGSCEALTFRVFVEHRELRIGPVKVMSTLAAEVTVRPGEDPVEVTAPGGLMAGPLFRTRVVLEVEAVGSGRPLIGRWIRPRLGTDEDFASVACTVAVDRVTALATEHGGTTIDPVPMPTGQHRDPQEAVVYAEEPDDPYVLVVPFAVDGTSVSSPLTSVPPAPAGARVEGAAAGFRHDLHVGSGAEGDYPVYTTVFYPPGSWFHTHYQTGTIHGWTGGIQPGGSEVLGTKTVFTLREMEGDGQAGAAFVGLLVVVVDQEGTVPATNLASVVAAAFRDALAARLAAILPVGARSGLTMAEATALRAELPGIAGSVLASAGAPLAAASTDQLVGVGVPTWSLADLLAGGRARQAVDITGSGSSYRVETYAQVT